ncbi:MAG: nucleotidyltransferase domain-containing protein [Acetobacteraceae bacterium]|nr:nucleotidyltransferase domain-containing protein [Acetobacteraceae bacterium]
MSALLPDDPVLVPLRHRLERMYGDTLARAVLFGSRARGDWNDESDYDVAVFLTGIPDWWQEMDRLADLRVEFLGGTGDFLDAKPFHISEWSKRSALMGEIRRDGIDF